MADIAVRLEHIRLVRGETTILDGIDWTIRDGERWVVLGPNGSGKTSLVRIVSLYLHPTSGTVEVLGATLGHIDVRTHRQRIGVASSSFADLLRPTVTAADVVVTAKHAALETWWHQYDDADRERALALLDRFGCAALAGHEFATLSSGERQRVQLARTLMTDPGLVLLDEPTAGLDLAGREDLLQRLAALAADPTTPPTILVTHHVDEIPPGFTHVLVLRGGRVLARGPLLTTLTAATLSNAFGIDVELQQRDGRWFAWTRPASNATH